ncbi:hypothetical protein IV203_033267 [Nitzschia inconspicua]|uniref:Uncharacterized protein n=1 Tax=Nitzschia inconspicua TaxID=303405 RepID=A0A9K3KLU4_9STRA|nr:hypothetical protein IV203_033267 [Nitzschia inconspicua]
MGTHQTHEQRENSETPEIPGMVLKILGQCGFLDLAGVKSLLAVFGTMIPRADKICMVFQSKYGYAAVPKEYRILLFADRAAWKQVIVPNSFGQRRRQNRRDISPIEWTSLLFHTNYGPINYQVCIFNVDPSEVTLESMGGKADGAIFAYNFAFHASLYNVVRMYRHMQHFCNSGAPAVSVATNYDPFRDRKHRPTLSRHNTE